MHRQINCQVIVVGAGPGGATAAAMLARTGVEVVILEAKQAAPGQSEKPCAGGLIRHAHRFLPRGVRIPYQDDSIRLLMLSNSLADSFRRTTRAPLFRTVLRSEFDGALASHAEACGARLERGVEVRRVVVTDSQVVVLGEGVRLSAAVLIGADGWNSVVRRQCGLGDVGHGVILEPAYVGRAVPVEMGALRHRAAIDWSSPARGYAWVFPKADHVSFGAVGPPGSDRSLLESCASSLLKACCAVPYEVISECLSYLPLGTSRIPRTHGRVLLVGDAAALVDPFTREGITQALWSATLAARAVLRFLRGRPPGLDIYERLLGDGLLAELNAAKRVRDWFYADPCLAQRRLRDNSLVWHAFCSLLSGQIGYRTLLRLLPPVCLHQGIGGLAAEPRCRH